MKQIAKKKINKVYLAIAVLVAVLALLVGAYFLITAIANGRTDDTVTSEPPELWEGEDTYLNLTVAYPRIEEGQITYISVYNSEGVFELLRFPDNDSAFRLIYTDPVTGESDIYYTPPIVDAEGSFDFESLYAIEQNDGYGRIYMLTYLCNAIGTTYFTERIPLPVGEDEESVRERELLLEEYGLDEKNAEYVSFVYDEKDSSGNTVGESGHMIVIGDRALSGSGYYFMADERDCIYYTTSNSLEYATRGFHTFVKGVLVAEGAEGDSSLEPYLTTDFKQWALEEHRKEGERVTADSNVVCRGDVLTPVRESAQHEPTIEEQTSGYYLTEDSTLSFDLPLLKEHDDYERIKSLLVGREIGACSESDGEVILTLVTPHADTDVMNISFGDRESLTYVYTVSEIEGILLSDREITEDGAPLSDASLIKITYSYTVDGKAATSVTQHAVLDLTSELLDPDGVAALRASTVGVLDTPIDLTVTYTKDNAPSTHERLVVSDIMRILDSKGNTTDEITRESYVSIRYYEVIDGVRGEEKELPLNMSDIEDGDSLAPFRDALLGQGIGESVNIEVYSEVFYKEVLSDFVTYRIDATEAFITESLVVSFRFQNASDRDPYYGGSFYENTMSGSYKLYGLNQGALEEVVKALGGIENNSNSSEGLTGETVAIGLTHENMVKYGLYAHKIYFELPRGIYDRTEGTEEDSDDELSDYSWYGTLGFTLYISEEDPATGMRYVGSDMYDLVALVDGSKLEFLSQSFTELYARKDLILIDVANLSELEISFDMEDVYGDFYFDVSRRTMYMGYQNGKLHSSTTYFDGATATQKFYVNATAADGSMETELGKYAEELGAESVSMTALYNKVLGGGEELFAPNSKETLGVSYFLEAFEELQLCRYQGTLTSEEQAAAKQGEPIMRVRILLDAENASSRYYTYEFYRFDDRRIMVSLYQTTANGTAVNTPVSDFYISTFAFKQIVSGFTSILNAEEFDNEVAYPDEN